MGRPGVVDLKRLHNLREWVGRVEPDLDQQGADFALETPMYPALLGHVGL